MPSQPGYLPRQLVLIYAGPATAAASVRAALVALNLNSGLVLQAKCPGLADRRHPAP